MLYVLPLEGACRSAYPPAREPVQALFGGDVGKRGPGLLDLLAAAVLALHLAFFVVHQGQNFVKEFREVIAEGFVVGHTDRPHI